jgi:hypothetical protein
MNNSTSAVTSKKSESEVSHGHSNKQEDDDIVTITETIKLKSRQYEVLKNICDVYRFSLSEYIQEVLIETMKSDIEEGMSIVHNISSETINCERCKTDTEGKILPEALEEIDRELETPRPWGTYWICKERRANLLSFCLNSAFI